MRFNASAYIPYNLETVAEDVTKMSTNYIDIVSDCGGIDGFEPKNILTNRFPLVSWLLGTNFAGYLRRRSADAENFSRADNQMIIRNMSIPGTVWTLDPENSGDDCCWTMPDFAKCASEVPLFGLCLKDCDNIFEELLYKKLNVQRKQALDGIAREGENFVDVNDRLMRLWMAFYTAHTAVLGTSTTSDNVTKPFHGLVEVLENEAVMKLYGANILGAFASLGCRLDVLGGENFVFAVHPLIYNSIKSQIVKGQNGEYPTGWTRDGETIRFHGIGFITDRMVPVNMSARTGEVWMLSGDSVGLFLATNIMPEEDFIIRNDFTEQTKSNGCGRVCTYMYNYGAVANNNAQRLAVITDVPISGDCGDSIGDLGGLIQPTTLISK